MACKLLKIKQVKPTINHRDVGDVTGLMASIKKHGQLVPIIIHESGGKYQIVAGHRRHEAMTKLGMGTIRAEVLRGLSEKQIAEKQAIENEARKNLSVFEQALLYRKLQSEHGLKPKEIAVICDVSISHVNKTDTVFKYIPKKYIPLISYNQGNKKDKGMVSITTAGVIATECKMGLIDKTESKILLDMALDGCGIGEIKDKVAQKRAELLDIKTGKKKRGPKPKGPKKKPTIEMGGKRKFKSMQVYFTLKQSDFDKYFGTASEFARQVREVVTEHLVKIEKARR